MKRNKKGQFTKDPRPEKRKRVALLCPICGVTFEVGLYRTKSSVKICCSRSCANVIRFTGKKKKKFGTAKWFWEMKQNEYRNLHKRIYKLLGRPKKCLMCHDVDRKLYWANKTGKYLLKKDDWLSLCASCHWKYDDEKRKQKKN